MLEKVNRIVLHSVNMNRFSVGDKVLIIGPAIVFKSFSVNLEWIEEDTPGVIDLVRANGHIRVLCGDRLYEVHEKQVMKV